MKLLDVIKKNTVIRCIGKKINVYGAFKHDAVDFSRNFLEEATKAGDYRYNIMLLVHSLEKGMCMANPRPFGFDKVKELMTILNMCSEKSSFEYSMGISILEAWKKFFDEHNWKSEKLYEDVQLFLENKESLLETGAKKYCSVECKDDAEYFEKIIFSRHSVRDFKDELIRDEDLVLPLKAFVETPTACNRQMCRVLYVKTPEIKEKLDDVIIGLSGFNKEHVNYFIITYDLAAFAYSGERQQGLFNAGLCTMNFVNALHVNGIGSCCLQWSNKYKEDCKIRKLLKLRDSERIGIVIGAGYYLSENYIPCSVRRPICDVYKEV